jgi:hypothetical protein
MNKSLAAVSALTLTATALLTATACSGSGGSDDSASDKITDVASSPSASVTPSGSESASTAPAGAPAIKLPADVQVEIEDPAGSAKDAATAKADGDLKYALVALQDGFTQGSGEVPSMKYAYGMQPGLYWSKQIKQFKDAGKTITGLDRFYDIDLRVTSRTSALAHYCEDQRKSFSKNVKTGHVNTTTPSDKDFYRFTVTLALDSTSGVWKVNRQNWTQGDKSCITS